MNRGNLSRRGFLERSLLGLTVGAGLPIWFARETLVAEEEQAVTDAKKISANDRAVMGAIGIGSPQSRGRAIMHDAMQQKAQYVAVCDLDGRHLENAYHDAKNRGHECQKYKDFRELLARKDINAVTIATPDHWHAIIAIAAMKAGKDVYCEKPLTLTIAEGQAVVKTARATDRVFQVGSQQRSDARFRLACELVRNGRLGNIKTVETWIGSNPESGRIPVVPPPPELDWDFWLGPTPKVDYVESRKNNHTFTRCHYEFRWWYEYSGGKMTDWGAHHNDIAQWALGMDGSGPVAVEAEGKEPSKEPNSYNCHPTFKVTYTYATGTKLVCRSKENGVRFEGEDGKWIFVNRGKIEASDKKLVDEPLPANAVRLAVSTNHMANFMECLQSRKRPICDVEIGHRSVTVCHLGVIALRTGKKLQWDPAKEQFADAESNKWLSRPMRAPWKFEVS